MIQLYTFGGCRVVQDGSRLDALSGQRKALALLALLAAAGEPGIGRDLLLACLWPESSEERARTSLKQLVHSLRQQLGSPDILLGTAELRLNPELVSSDVAEFRHALARADWAAAAALYAGPFLEGFYLRGADDFERRVADERAALAREAARALETLADDADRRGDRRAALEWWRRLAYVEPLSARAAIGLMHALDAVGERAAAVRHAQTHELLVREAVGADPDPAVAALATRFQRMAPVAAPSAERGGGDSEPEETGRDAGEPPAGSPPGGRRAVRSALVIGALVMLGLAVAVGGLRWGGERAPSVIPSRSLVVLPFVNTGGGAANEHFSSGLTDELIGALGRIRELRVVGRTSAYAAQRRGLDAPGLARALDVGSVLEGSVRRDGERLKVSAQLVDATSDRVLWAESYDRELRDVFAVQEDIARAIVTALRVELVGPSRAVFAARAPADPLASELYLRGKYVFATHLGRDGMMQAASYFEQAIARDSTYASAWAGLSDARARLAIFGYGRSHEEFALAKAAARRALALDSTLAAAHAALAHVLFVYDFEWDAAEHAFRRALELDPGYTFARLPFAICLASRERFGEALAQLDTARAADPLAPVIPNVRGRVLLSAGQPDSAIRSLREALSLNPQLDLAWQQLGHAYLQKGMHDEAISALRRAATLSGARDSAHLAYAYAVVGRPDEARRVLGTLVGSPERATVLSAHLAMAYAALGEIDEAFRWLDRGYQERGSFMAGVNVTSAYTPLHGDPRWRALLVRMGLQGGATR